MSLCMVVTVVTERKLSEPRKIFLIYCGMRVSRFPTKCRFYQQYTSARLKIFICAAHRSSRNIFPKLRATDGHGKHDVRNLNMQQLGHAWSSFTWEDFVKTTRTGEGHLVPDLRLEVSYVSPKKRRYFLHFREYLNRFVWEPIDPRTKVRVYFFSTGWWFSWRFQQSSGHGRRHMGKITLEETSCWGEIHWAERIRVCLHGSRTLAVEKVIRRLLPSRL